MVTKARTQSARKIVLSSKLARKAGSPEEGLRLVEAALVRFPKNRSLQLEKARNLHRIGSRFEDELASWNTCFASFREQSRLAWFKFCRRLIQQKYRLSTDRDLLEAKKRLVDELHARAHEYLIDAPVAKGDDEDRQRVAYETSAWISEWEAVEQGTVQAYARHFAQFPDTKSVKVYRQYAQALFETDAAAAVSKFTELKSLAEKNFPLETGISSQTDEKTARKSGPFWVQIADELIVCGQIELAQTILKGIPEGVEGLRDTQIAADTLNTRLAKGNQERSPAPSFGDAEENSIVTWSPAEPSDKVLFVFTGGGGRLYYVLQFFHKLFTNLGCHVVYLKANESDFFMRGDAWNGPAELERKLSAIRHGLGATHSYALGSSSGAYSALRYGIALNVDSILAFNIPIVSPADTRLPGVQTTFQSLQRDFPNEEFDLVRYCANANDIPRTTVAFSEGCLRDRAAAEKLAVYPQIELEMALGTNSHASIKEFVAQGRFFPMLERMVSEPK